jgi:hypothetical protein
MDSAAVGQLAYGADANHLFLLTGVKFTSSYWNSDTGVGSLSMYYSIDGGTSWNGPIPTSMSTYQSFSSEMTTAGTNTAYITTVSSPNTNIGTIYALTFSSGVWTKPVVIANGWGVVLEVLAPQKFYVMYEATNADLAWSNSTDFVTWIQPNVISNAAHYFNEGLTLSSQGPYQVFNRLSFVWTPDDASGRLISIVQAPTFSVTLHPNEEVNPNLGRGVQHYYFISGIIIGSIAMVVGFLVINWLITRRSGHGT